MRRDVFYYFQQAYRRELAAVPPPLRFVSCEDAEAGFSFRMGEGHRIVAVDYRCTTCVTLMALCEHVAEQIRGATFAEARSLTAAHLLGQHPEIPPSRHSRAQLAASAARAALDQLTT